MENILKKISGLLKHQDPMHRCGAALVLAELAPKSKDVVKALGEALPEAGQQFSGYILEALQAIASPAAVPYVMPLLNSQDMALRMRASAIVACGGSAVVPEIRRMFNEASRQEKLVYIDLLARIHNSETLQMLLDLLFEPDFGLVKETCEAVKRHVASAPLKERLKLHKKVVKFMNSPSVKKQERVLTSSLLLLGHIGRSEASAILIKNTSPKISPYVRRHALIALKNIEYDKKTSSAVFKKILPYLDEPDEDIVRFVLEIIGRMPLLGIKPVQLRKFLQSKHGSVRAFAARMLSSTDTTDNNRLLMELLNHEDNEVREIAANALAGHKKSTPMLLKALASEKDDKIAWRIARILRPHTADLNKTVIKKFTAITTREMLAGTPRHEPLLYFLRNADPKSAEKILLDIGMKHKRAKRWANAVDCLRRLLHTEIFDSDVSYALSICDLKVSKKEISSQYRMEDHALRGFSSLFHQNSAGLMHMLKDDKTLEAPDIYYLGFHFSEVGGNERDFGRELFKHLVKTWPKSKEAKDAKARLGR